MMALKVVTVKELSQILGAMVAAHPTIHTQPFSQPLTTRKSQVIIGVSIRPQTTNQLGDLSWWVTQAHLYSGRPLQITHRDVTIESNASMSGWGASCQGENIGGP